MDYKFLANKELEKLFGETDFSVGEIFLSIINRTGVEIQNRSQFREITDQEWYVIIEETLKDALEDDPILSDEEWDETINKIFNKNER